MQEFMEMIFALILLLLLFPQTGQHEQSEAFFVLFSFVYQAPVVFLVHICTLVSGLQHV